MISVKIQTLADKARKLSQEGKWREAAAQWDEIIPLLIDGVVEAYHSRGQARYNAGDDEGAKADDHRARYHRRGFDYKNQSRAETTQSELYTTPSSQSLGVVQRHVHTHFHFPSSSDKTKDEQNKPKKGWWDKLSTVEKILTAIATILAAPATLFAIALFYSFISG